MSGLPEDAANELAARRAARAAKDLIESVPATARLEAGLKELAPHPENPRRGELGDLSEIVASMKTMGVIEPLVVTTREAHLGVPQYEGHKKAIGEAPYVIVAGHRRHAAAVLAGLEKVPIEVRPDLSLDGLDLEVMAVENSHRAPLKPMEKAELFAALQARGRSQREIARRTGFAQGTISKHIKLLSLADELQNAVRSGLLNPTDAWTIAELEGPENQLAAWKLVTESSLKADDAVARQRDVVATIKRAQEARQRASDEGLEVVTFSETDGELAATPKRISEPEDIEYARAAGHLAAAIDRSGMLYYVSTAAAPEALPATTVSVPNQPTAADKDKEAESAARIARRDRAAAARNRDGACAVVAARKIVATEALRRISAAAVSVGLSAEALTLAHRWLRAEEFGPDLADPRAFAQQVHNSGEAVQLAYAMALAADELHVRQLSDQPDPRAAAHIRRLMADVKDFVPSDWDRDVIDRVEPASAVIP